MQAHIPAPAPSQSTSAAAGIEVVALTKRYASGSYYCLLGPSGCGKSTTLRMIAGHESVTGGDILLENRHITDLPAAARGTAMMFQGFALFPHLSAGIHTVAPTGAQLAADPQAVILGGAGLAGMAAAVQPQVAAPVIDSVVAGASWALRAHALPPERQLPGFDVAWESVSPEMAALGTGRVV